VQSDSTSNLWWCYSGVLDALHSQPNCRGNASSFTPAEWVDSADENGNDWQNASDALGHLRAVVEPMALETDYTYDAFGNLWNVSQKGISSDTARTRSFQYTGLSQLAQSYNPETGTVCYGTWSSSTCTQGYDADGNLVSKTDARGVVTSYGYDQLNRILSKTYTNAPPGTLSSCYLYDTAGNGIGRLGAEWTQGGSCSSTPSAKYQSMRTYGTYDAMGRAVAEQQCVAGYCTSAAVPSQPTANCTSLSGGSGLQYCYDLAGNLLAYTNGLTSAAAGNYSQAATAFSQTFDAAGRLATVGSSWNDTAHPATLFSNSTYAPNNALSNWLLGASLWTARQYDNRLRICNQQSAQQQISAPQCQ